MGDRMYYYEEDIPVSKLQLDLKNPRLPDIQTSQIDTLRLIARLQGEKLLALAKHITTYGLNPAEKFIVIPDDHNQYIVLDGNRRLTALRLLETPSIVEGYVSEDLFKQFRIISETFLLAPIEDAPCIVFQDNEQAVPWIELIHDGESGGAGLVKWSAQQRSRYQARKGNKALHLIVLDFVTQHGQLSPETVEKIKMGKYPTSTLKRVLSTPYVREKLGIEKKGQIAFTHYPKSEIIKGLSRVVDDIGTGRINVNDVHSQSDRIEYINGFDNDALPSEKNRNDEAVPIEDAPDNHVPTQRLRPERRASISRKKLIPSSLRLTINVQRINNIYHELKRKLIVDKTPNAVAVLLRAFLEMSVDEYIDRKGIQIRGRDTLANKVFQVAEYMEQNDILARSYLRPIRRAASDSESPYSTTTLNGYVHNRHFSPSPNDLIATWDTLQIFIVKLWE